MAAILSAEWFHLLHRRQTWGVLGGTLAVLVASLLLSRGYNYHSAYLAYLAALGGGANAAWLAVIPLVGSFTAGDRIRWSRHTGFARYERSRQPLARLLIGQLTATVLETMVLVLGALAVTLLLGLLFLPAMPAWHTTPAGLLTITVPGPASAYTPYPMFLHALFFHHPLLYLGIVSAIVACATAFWGLCSLALSVWTSNAYVVLGGPWLIYVGLSYLFGAPLDAVMGGWMPIQLAGAFVSSAPVPTAWQLAIWPIAMVGVAGLTGMSLTIRRRIAIE